MDYKEFAPKHWTGRVGTVDVDIYRDDNDWLVRFFPTIMDVLPPLRSFRLSLDNDYESVAHKAYILAYAVHEALAEVLGIRSRLSEFIDRHAEANVVEQLSFEF